MAANITGQIRSAWYPDGYKSASEPKEHRCGNCFGPLGKSAIPCKNESKGPDHD